ncbi:MAG: creatininase family protein [Rhodospirillaceae bacterium]|nr:creatininase family protein [Rhodospirillaceae bacterium]
MRFRATAIAFFAAAMLGAPAAYAAAPAAAAGASGVELDMMTWPELKAAMAAGKNMLLIYTGGTEQRGPQNVMAGHNMMGRPIVKAIAEKLGNAIALPVLPFSPTGMSAEIPGSFNLSADVLGMVLEQLAEDGVTNGFKTVILMGDSGGGQGPNGVYAAVAKKLDDKYKDKGIHVYYANESYTKANAEMTEILFKEGHPRGAHAGILDTSLMLYLDPENKYVRRDQLPTALGDPLPEPGKPRDPNAPSVKNGISGDARKSSAEIGKRFFDLKVDTAVKQIKALTGAK